MVGVQCLACLSFLHMDMDRIIGCRGVIWTLFATPLASNCKFSTSGYKFTLPSLQLPFPPLHLISTTHPCSFITPKFTIYLFIVPLCRIPPRSLPWYHIHWQTTIKYTTIWWVFSSCSFLSGIFLVTDLKIVPSVLPIKYDTDKAPWQEAKVEVWMISVFAWLFFFLLVVNQLKVCWRFIVIHCLMFCWNWEVSFATNWSTTIHNKIYMKMPFYNCTKFRSVWKTFREEMPKLWVYHWVVWLYFSYFDKTVYFENSTVLSIMPLLHSISVQLYTY